MAMVGTCKIENDKEGSILALSHKGSRGGEQESRRLLLATRNNWIFEAAFIYNWVTTAYQEIVKMDMVV